MNAGPSKKSIRQQSVSVVDLLAPDTSGCNDDEDEDDLVDFLPALEVLGADESVVVKQSLSHNRVGRVDHRVVNRGQALPVPIIWTAQDNSKEGVGGNERK